jgi:hypothetical protein
MVAKTLVAAIAALLTVISVPALAQQENATRCPGGVCRPIPPPGPRSPPPQSDYSQQQPRRCVEIGSGHAGELQFEWQHDGAGRRICQVFGPPGFYCECKNRLGEIFSGIVQ